MLSNFDDVKSKLVYLQILQRIFAGIDQRKRSDYLLVYLCGVGNMISLKPLFYMVQRYVFEHLITSLLSCVVSLLTCCCLVKRISRNKNVNGVLWVKFCSPRGGLWTKLSSIHMLMTLLFSKTEFTLKIPQGLGCCLMRIQVHGRVKQPWSYERFSGV